eukprot:g42350.t1
MNNFSLGFQVDEFLMQLIGLRYTDPDLTFSYVTFICCLTKLDTMIPWELAAMALAVASKPSADSWRSACRPSADSWRSACRPSADSWRSIHGDGGEFEISTRPCGIGSGYIGHMGPKQSHGVGRVGFGPVWYLASVASALAKCSKDS